MNNNGSRDRVIVTDVDMPFMSMVTFMVKWAIASIPAFIILAVIGAVVGGIATCAMAGLGAAVLHH
jgi:hypothetical protein